MPPPERPSEQQRLQDVLKGTHEHLDGLSHDVEKRKALHEINFGLSPLDISEGPVVKKVNQPTEQPNFTEITDASQRKDWFKAVRKLFDWIFRSPYSAEGLGYLSEHKQNLPKEKMLGIIRQIEAADQSKLSLKNRVLASLVRTDLQRSIEKDHVLERMAQPTSFVDVTTDGMTLEQTVRQQAGAKAEDILTQLNAKTLLGVLRYDKPLPKGIRIFFDAAGFPVWASFQKIEPSAAAAVPIYREKKPEEKKELSKNTENAEFLKRHLRPGDILITSQGGSAQSITGKLYQVGIRMAARDQQDVFHGTHTMIVGEDGKIHHMTPQGFESGTVEDIFLKQTKYQAVSVLRMEGPAGEKFRKQTAQHVERLLGLTRKKQLQYDKVKAGKIAANALIGQRDQRIENSDEHSSICTDPIAKGAEGIEGLQDIAQANTPEDIARASRMKMLWSLEFERQARIIPNLSGAN